MTPDEILDKAADLIEFGDLAKGRLYMAPNAYCANGAINKAHHGYWMYTFGERNEPSYAEAISSLADDVPDDYGPLSQLIRAFHPERFETNTQKIAAWNNEEDRTRDEVVEKLRSVAKKYREKVQ